MTYITEEQFTAGMREAVAERGGDYVYPKDNPGWYVNDSHCQYQVDGEPACLIGLALSKIDPGLVPVQGDFSSARLVLGDLASYDVAVAAGYAQADQDDGKTWGEALQTYEGVLARRKEAR